MTYNNTIRLLYDCAYWYSMIESWLNENINIIIDISINLPSRFTDSCQLFQHL
jgi:hypothetical protein